MPSRDDANGELRRLAIVLWKGDVGGAETLSASLAKSMSELGAVVTIVFIGDSQPLAERLDRIPVPHRALKLGRGRAAVRHARRYATTVRECGPDGALLVERGFLGAALRVGGYRAPIIAVEHGEFLQRQASGDLGGLARLSRVAGAVAVDAEVAVSDFMLSQMLVKWHACRTERIYNGVDPARYTAHAASPTASPLSATIGFAGRLVHGKGADHLIRACALVGQQFPTTLLIAGDGPERTHLGALARKTGAGTAIEFLGVIDDIPALWRQCDVVVVPPDSFKESFSMVTLEAMACGKPIVATANGAIPELIIDGATGTLVTPGDVSGIASAIADYILQPALARTHGAAARQRAVTHFHIDTCARAYLSLFRSIAAKRIES
jgi:glycosyltransferase involved in cell wall biosynthesis